MYKSFIFLLLNLLFGVFTNAQNYIINNDTIPIEDNELILKLTKTEGKGTNTTWQVSDDGINWKYIFNSDYPRTRYTADSVIVNSFWKPIYYRGFTTYLCKNEYTDVIKVHGCFDDDTGVFIRIMDSKYNTPKGLRFKYTVVNKPEITGSYLTGGYSNYTNLALLLLEEQGTDTLTLKYNITSENDNVEIVPFSGKIDVLPGTMPTHICKIELIERKKNDPIIVGIVRDLYDFSFIEDVDVTLTYRDTYYTLGNDVTLTTKTDMNGHFTFTVPPEKAFSINLDKAYYISRHALVDSTELSHINDTLRYNYTLPSHTCRSHFFNRNVFIGMDNAKRIGSSYDEAADYNTAYEVTEWFSVNKMGYSYPRKRTNEFLTKYQNYFNTSRKRVIKDGMKAISSLIQSGCIWYDNGQTVIINGKHYYMGSKIQYGLSCLYHELGHAAGLNHTFYPSDLPTIMNSVSGSVVEDTIRDSGMWWYRQQYVKSYFNYGYDTYRYRKASYYEDLKSSTYYPFAYESYFKDNYQTYNLKYKLENLTRNANTKDVCQFLLSDSLGMYMTDTLSTIHWEIKADGNIIDSADGNDFIYSYSFPSIGSYDISARINNTDINFEKTYYLSVTINPLNETGSIKDNKYTYQSVKIGDQKWLKENVKSIANDGIRTKYYSFKEASRVCPNGWHLPTLKEWETLSDYLGGRSLVANRLCSNKHNSTNFSVEFDEAFMFENISPVGEDTIRKGFSAYFWTSTPFDSENSYFKLLTNEDQALFTGDFFNEGLLSVRCICDTLNDGIINKPPSPIWYTKIESNNYNDTITFYADSSYSDVSELEYLWDFNGDGKWDTDTLSIDSISFKYCVPSNFNVVLKAIDDKRNENTYAREIEIKNIVDTISDYRDSRRYGIVKIGEDWWMADDLKYGKPQSPAIPTSDTLVTKFYFFNDSMHFEKYGALYQNKYIDSLCPKGWHVPFKNEWSKLYEFIGGREKSRHLVHTKEGMFHTDEFGFHMNFKAVDFEQAINLGYYNPSIWFPSKMRYLGHSHVEGMDIWIEDKIKSISIANYDYSSYAKSCKCIKNQWTHIPVKNTITDSRDGKEYLTVDINGEWWFAENLALISNLSNYYNNDSLEYSKFGRQYSYLELDSVCPSGWHIPSDNEWKELETFLGVPNDELAWTGYKNANLYYIENETFRGVKSNSGYKLHFNNETGFDLKFVKGYLTGHSNIERMSFWCNDYFQEGNGLFRLFERGNDGIGRILQNLKVDTKHFVRCKKD